MTSALRTIVTNNRTRGSGGIYSVCSMHSQVLAAAMLHAKAGGYPLLVEATANQVNQYGGYSGMNPAAAHAHIGRIAAESGLDSQSLILGGDHLGPVCWTRLSASEAMQKARSLVEAYVEAGFTKLHLDCSMPCADDPLQLDRATIAGRATELCAAAERVVAEQGGLEAPHYVIGTEVPAPGGASEGSAEMAVTSRDDVRRTVEVHREHFIRRGLTDAWRRVVAVVVQPGVEFDRLTVHEFDPELADDLGQWIVDMPDMVYEAHSTDYQPPSAYRQLVRRHFAILKVGPQLTFAMREALFALCHIEEELIDSENQSKLRRVCEQVMQSEPDRWTAFYGGQAPGERVLRRYSFSDRIRYYWGQPAIAGAVNKLLANLAAIRIPLPLLSQYLPLQYRAVRNGTLRVAPQDLIRFHIQLVLEDYADACACRSTS